MTFAEASAVFRGRASGREPAGVDRERQQRRIVAPDAVREEAGELRPLRELRVAAGAHGVGGVGRPERHPPPSGVGPAGRRRQAQRAVPNQRVVLIVEPRAGVGDAQHVALVVPLGADREVVGARAVGQRHLDVVAEAEAGAPRQLAGVLLRRERRRQVELLRRRELDVEPADVPALAEIELGRERHVEVQRGRAACPFWIVCCVASSSPSGLSGIVYGVRVSTL